MVAPVINALPVAPTRADAQPDYSAKADTFTAALPQFSIQVNAAVSWMADSMAATLDYKNAATASANLASLAAQTAATQAALAASGGAAQVSLAATQAQNAAQSATNAQTYAAAAQAAAGAPSLVGHDAFDVLQINSAKNGVQWGKSGQAVGDILVTARAPDSTYAMAGRVPYLKSAYPDLAALVGTPADTDRSTVTNASLNSSFSSDVIAPFGVAVYGGLIIVLVTNAAFCYTSSDNGVTWVRRPTPFSAGKALAVLNGMFVATISLNNINYVYTTTDGVTWTQRAFITGTASYALVGVVAGLFVVATPAQSAYQTSPDGITWTQRTTFAANNQALINVNGNLVAFVAGSTYSVSTDGLVWNTYNNQAASGASLNLQQIVFYNGLYYAAEQTTGLLYTKSSLTSGGLWTPAGKVFVDPATGNPETMSSPGACGVSPTGDAIIFNSGSARSIISNDGGVTWTSKTTPAVFNVPLCLSNKFMSFANAINNQSYTLPLRTYDPTTSFITPRVTQPLLPLQTYIKGKLA